MAMASRQCVRGIEGSKVAAFLSAHYGVPLDCMHVMLRPLPGGLCSAVAQARVRFLDARRMKRTATIVVKSVKGTDLREAEVYQRLLAKSLLTIAPVLFGVEYAEHGTAYLYLEWIGAWRPWPWSDSEVIGLVLDRLAHAHASLPVSGFSQDLRAWDYEAELTASARSTLQFFEQVTRDDDFAGFRRALRAVRRQVAALPAIRRQLAGAFGAPVVLHGDAHPGNAIVRWQRGGVEPILLDWARARLGSPLEDVCSWLQSLGYWEPEARRRHDTLLRRYLGAHGRPTTLGASLRELYWLAGTCNALAGALKYHLLRMADPVNPGEIRRRAAESVRDWGRIVMRADACWRN